MIPTREAGTLIAKSLAAERRIDVRIRRLPSTGPARDTAAAEKYFSSTRSDTCAMSRHHCAASPPVYGSLESSSAGRAPFAASRRAHASTFAR
jgi:hypothetical protein